MALLMTTAVFENGVFRPTLPVSLRDGEQVEIVYHPVAPPPSEMDMEQRRALVARLNEIYDATDEDEDEDDGYDAAAAINAERLRIGARPTLLPDEGAK